MFVGFALLAGLTVAGAVLGTGFAAYRWLRGDKVNYLPRALARWKFSQGLCRSLPLRGAPADGTPPTT